jgi:hypothetical protein
MRLLVLSFAGFVLAPAGLVMAAFTVVAGLAVSLAVSVRRLNALLACRIAAIRPISGASRLGCWGLTTGRAHGQRRSAFPPRRRHRPASVGVLKDQAEGDTDDGPKQRSYDDEELTATAKRSVQLPSKVE